MIVNVGISKIGDYSVNIVDTTILLFMRVK